MFVVAMTMAHVVDPSQRGVIDLPEGVKEVVDHPAYEDKRETRDTVQDCQEIHRGCQRSDQQLFAKGS